jgi:hypothetical protein
MKVTNVIWFSADQFDLLRIIQELNDVSTAHVRGSHFSRLRRLVSELRVNPASRRMCFECSAQDKAAGRQDVKSCCNVQFLVYLPGNVIGTGLALSVSLIYSELGLWLVSFHINSHSEIITCSTEILVAREIEE